MKTTITPEKARELLANNPNNRNLSKPLARKYAAAIQAQAKGPDVPLWAKQMEAFILEDMDELETARIMIGGFIASGQVRDPGELRFLDRRLKDIEGRIQAKKSERPNTHP